MEDHEPTMASLALGSALENVMISAGLHQAELARRLRRSPAYINRIISGTRGGRAQDVVAWLDQCNVTGVLRLEILSMRLPCGLCGCRCDHTGLLKCCPASGDDRSLIELSHRYPEPEQAIRLIQRAMTLRRQQKSIESNREN